jgi:hypothetical protein
MKKERTEMRCFRFVSNDRFFFFFFDQNKHRTPRGLFISEKDKGMMSSLVHNWPASEVG